MSASVARDVLAGAAAGLFAGVALAWAMAAQESPIASAGLLGLDLTGPGLPLHLLASPLLAAGFGGVFRYQPHTYAATMGAGLFYGLLLWIAGPLTLGPLLHGQGPTWTVVEANVAFPSLIGHMLYGGLVGLTFYLLATWYSRVRPASNQMGVGSPRLPRRVLILGGGFAGVSTALRLEELLVRDPTVAVTVVSQSNYLLFTPMLAEVASGAVEAQHVSAPLRACFDRTRVIRAEVEAIDPVERVVRVRTGPSTATEMLGYDVLVLALGAVPHYYGLPGVEEHSFSLKSLRDASTLRDHVIALLERADAQVDPDERRRLLTFVVIGGGFAGTETVAELFDLVRSVFRYYPDIAAADARFTLIHAGERILPELSVDMATYALQKLRTRGIEIILKARVAGATAEAVLLADGSNIPAGTVVWTAGNRPNPLLETLACERNRSGAVVVDGTLRVNGLEHVWAVGDCAEILDPHGKPCPPTAQHAMREGKLAAENVVATLRGTASRPFRFRPLGVLVALGHRTAVAEVRGWKFSGLLAWFMWRMVYLTKLPGLEKKLRVALDWTIELFFPRDIVLTSAPWTPARSETSDRRPPEGAV